MWTIYQDFNLKYLKSLKEAAQGPAARKWAEVLTSETRNLIKAKCINGNPNIKINDLFKSDTVRKQLFEEVDKIFQEWLEKNKNRLKIAK